MNILIIYLGGFYIFLGFVYLVIPLVYLEVGRPKDLIMGGLNLLIGLILIIKYKLFVNSYLVIFLLLTILVICNVTEIFLYRWNLLTDKEKNKFSTKSELKKNLSKISEAFNLGIRNFKSKLGFLKFSKDNKNIITKKWVRNDKNDNIKL